MKKNNMMLLVVALALISGVLCAGTNYIAPGDVVDLTFATTSPLKDAAVVKGTSKAVGAIVGVALNGSATAGEHVQVATKGIFDLPVTASSTVGNIAVGDYVFASMSGDPAVCTTVLSNVNTGVVFGQALEAITATETPGVYSTIQVRLMQSAD